MKATRALPDQATLNRLLRYDAETGKLYWRARPMAAFPDGRFGRAWAAGKWNTRYAGKEAISTPDSSGYLHGSIAGQFVLAHRVIWKMITGEEPVQIDHEDGDRSNNRLSNLASVSEGRNKLNLAIQRRNTSGVTGVTWRPDEGKWMAQINIGGSYHYLGLHGDFDQAVTVRRAAEQRLGFHPNHARRRAAQ